MSARIESASPLPFATGRTLIVENQAQFHPLDYVRGLAHRIASERCSIFERSEVIDVDLEQRSLRTAIARVSATDIVMATHTPKGFNLVQTELGPYREYGVAVELAAGTFAPGIFWSTERDRHSLRRLDAGGRTFVMVIGRTHKTGQADDAAECLAELGQYLAARISYLQVAARWSAQGYYPADGLPYIGPSAAADHLHIATGFAADGLTYGTLAARLLADRILGRDNEFADLYKATRIAATKAAKSFLAENINTAAETIKDYAKLLRPDQLGELQTGDGRIVELRGERCAVHRSADGKLHAVSPICTHLKCVVHWNSAENTWDCPCHGSRFDPDGSVIEGPAMAPLAPFSVGKL